MTKRKDDNEITFTLRVGRKVRKTLLMIVLAILSAAAGGMTNTFAGRPSPEVTRPDPTQGTTLTPSDAGHGRAACSKRGLNPSPHGSGTHRTAPKRPCG